MVYWVNAGNGYAICRYYDGCLIADKEQKRCLLIQGESGAELLDQFFEYEGDDFGDLVLSEYFACIDETDEDNTAYNEYFVNEHFEDK